MAAGVRRDHRRCEPAAGNVKYENEMESDLTHYPRVQCRLEMAKSKWEKI